MDPITIGAGIGAGANFLGGFFNNRANQIENERSRQWSLDQYNRQKQDNLDFWHQQNSYNSPEAQMSRFKDAGLNPNLIYGRGQSGNAGSITAPSASTPSFNPSVYNKQAESVSQFLNIQNQQLQNNNLKAQNDAIIENTILTKAKVLDQITGWRSKKFDLKFKQNNEMWNNDKLMYDVWKQKMDLLHAQKMNPLLQGAARNNVGIGAFKAQMAKIGITPGSGMFNQILGTLGIFIKNKKNN